MDNEPGPDNPLYEALAATQHEIWSHWMRYLLGTKAHRDETRTFPDGSAFLLLDPDDVAHWWRQIDTPYAELSEAEKASDREQVDRFWPAVAKVLATRTMTIKTVERRKKALADALGLAETIPFPRLIEAVEDFVAARPKPAPALLAYRGKKGCRGVLCTQGPDPECCYGWHCGTCDEPCSEQGHDCPEVAS